MKLIVESHRYSQCGMSSSPSSALSARRGLHRNLSVCYPCACVHTYGCLHSNIFIVCTAFVVRYGTSPLSVGLRICAWRRLRWLRLPRSPQKLLEYWWGLVGVGLHLLQSPRAPRHCFPGFAHNVAAEAPQWNPPLFSLAYTQILRGNSPSFLHWFHHVTVLLYCWHAGIYVVGPGLWFAAMNFCVHSVMYTYFAVRSCPEPPTAILKKIWSLGQWCCKKSQMFITSIQILQMIMGIIVTVVTAYHHQKDPASCFVNQTNYQVNGVLV